jgi:hypothetical protein
VAAQSCTQSWEKPVRRAVLASTLVGVAAVFATSGTLVAAAVGAQLSAQERAPFAEAQGKEKAGPRDATFDPAFETAAKGLTPTDDPLGVDDLILLRAAKAVAARKMGAADNGVWVKARGGMIPSGAFLLAHDLIAETFARRLGLDAASAAGLAAEIEAQLLAAARITPAEYFRATGATRPTPAARAQALRTALTQLYASSRIDRGFEVPYVAGYDLDAGDYVFVDCAVPFTIRRGGRTIPVGPLLVIHERVEKAILQDYATIYPSAHQVALRIERAAAKAAGAAWKPYDDFITAISNTISARDHAHVSDRLDLQPYYTFEDADNVALVRMIEAGRLAQASRARPMPGPAQPAGAACPGGGLK